MVIVKLLAVLVNDHRITGPKVVELKYLKPTGYVNNDFCPIEFDGS